MRTSGGQRVRRYLKNTRNSPYDAREEPSQGASPATGAVSEEGALL